MAHGQAEERKNDSGFTPNPEHTGVTKDPASTPGYFRLLLPGLAGRYVLRWGVTEWSDLKADWARFTDWLKAKGQENLPSPPTLEGANDAGKITGAANRLKASSGERTEAAVKHLMWQNGLKESLLDDALSIANGKGDDIFKQTQWEKFTETVRDKIAANRRARGYDYLLGSGSLLLTGYYGKSVASDIKKVFAETVAYEMGKDPKDITYTDLLHSTNKLMQETRHNFFTRNMGRLGADLVFFLGALANWSKLGWLKKYDFTDLGVGVKGVQLISEMLNKRTTIFEDLVRLIDNKLNPLKGLGAPITKTDIFDLYQKYTEVHDPSATFHDALSSQHHDGRDWAKAQVIFQRVTDLMNNTYKYKHQAKTTEHENDTAADFALPKFLYLLGNGLIDTYKPEQTLAYIEVANRYGIEAVRQVQRAITRGISPAEALANYPPEIMGYLHALEGKAVESAPTPAALPAVTEPGRAAVQTTHAETLPMLSGREPPAVHASLS
jgi:hypothetical protein